MQVLIKKLFFLLHLIFFWSYTVDAQITGYVVDEITHESIIGVTVFNINNKIGSYTNEFGYFKLNNISEPNVIQFSHIGYISKQITINKIPSDSILIIEISPNQKSFKEIKIVANLNHSFEIGKTYISNQDLLQTIQLGAEKDILKALQSRPGIKGGVEGTSGIHVRGGNSDQNLYLLESIPIYNTSHVFGLVSTFSGDNIRSISLYKGGFPSRYGGRLSSIVDIKVKNGHSEKWKSDVTLGILSSKIGISGPIIKNKWTISSSFRRSFYDLIPRIQNSLNPNIQDIILYNFSDFHIKSKFKINQNNSLSFFIYKSNDHWISKDKSTSTSLSQLDENGIKWGNQLSSLTWTTKYNASVFQNVSFLINQYKFALLSETNSTWTNDQGESENQEISTTYQSSIQDFGFKYKLDYLINQNHYLRIGTEITHHTLVPGQSRSISKDNGLISHDTLSSINKHRNIESRTFIEDEITFNKFSFNLGVSVSSLHLKNKSYWALEPRISTKYELSKKINLQISVSKMVQYLHVLSNNNLGLPTDLWVSSNNKIPPSRSWIYALGFEHHLFRDYNLIIESYFKKMNGLIEYREGASFLLYGKQWEEKVLSNGKGKSLGIEFQIKKSIKPFTGWIAYTISKTDRTFTDLNNGKSFPYKYDRLHELDILFSWHPNKKWNFQLNWKFHSGNPASFPIGFYPNIFYEGELSGSGVSNDIFELPDFSNYLTDTNSIPIYAGKNQERLPNYHRLDLAINRAFNYKNTSHNINFSIYNAYNRKNTFFVTHGYENQVVNFDTYKKNRKGTLNSFSQFPIIPSLSYNIKF